MRKPPDRRKEKTPAVDAAGVPGAQTQNVTQRTKQMNSIAHLHNVPSLVVGAVTIMQDADGRYSLNDLHRASGGDPKHAPGRWLRNQQTIELIQVLEAELTSQKTTETSQIWPVKTIEGRAGGTFVIKELAIDYASWIAAVFRLQVIRAYDQMLNVGGGTNLSAGMTPTHFAAFFAMRIKLMDKLSVCTDLGVGQGIYDNILSISRFIGQVTPPMRQIAPGLRQFDLLEGGAA